MTDSSRLPGASPNRAYIRGVDHLRAGFALLVLFYHGLQLFSANLIHHAMFVPADWPRTRNPLLAVVIEGHTGVAAFMVLSGFIFVQGTLGRAINYREFLRNRLLRIYPLYLLLVIFGFCATPTAFSLRNLVILVLPLGNFIIPPVGAFGAMAWAVAVEFQFYLVFPLLLRLLEIRGDGLLARMILIAAGLRLAAGLLGGNVHWMSYWSIAGRIDQFLLGMLAGAWYARRPTGSRARTWPALGAGALVWALLYGFHRLGGWPLHAWWKALWPDAEGGAWALFIATYVGVSDRLPRTIGRPLEAIGRISFSIYLLHFIVVLIVDIQGWILRPFANPYSDALLTTAVIVLPITLVCARLSYATIEAPFLALRRRYATSMPVAPAAPADGLGAPSVIGTVE